MNYACHLPRWIHPETGECEHTDHDGPNHWDGMYAIEVGMNKNAYTRKMTTANEAQAWAVYKGYNVHSGGKKRLLWIKADRHGTVKTVVKHRIITNKFGG